MVGVNGALRPLSGWTAATFLPLARLFGLNPFVPGLLAAMVAGDPRSVRRLLEATGSRVDAAIEARYQRLMRKPAHLAGTLRMFAHWDLRALAADLPRLGSDLTLLSATADRTIAPHEAGWVQQRVPGAVRLSLPGLGHLAHEEAPAAVARLLLSVARSRGLLDNATPAMEPGR